MVKMMTPPGEHWIEGLRLDVISNLLPALWDGYSLPVGADWPANDLLKVQKRHRH
jgi:hypothetical protein